MRSQKFVQTVEDLCGPQVLDARKSAGKIRPKLAQKLFPVELMVRYPVEVLFESCSKVIANVAGKEACQKSRHETTFVFRDKSLFVEPDIVPVAKKRQGRGIGRRPANPELLHTLDERGLGKARWRLCKMLFYLNFFFSECFAGGHCGQACTLLVVFVVLSFLIQFQKAAEANHLPGRAQIKRAALRLSQNIDCGAFEFGRFHLASERPCPDEFVELCLVRFQAIRGLPW